MIEEIAALAAPHARKIEVVQQPLAEPPKLVLDRAEPSAEQIHLMDSAFVSDHSREESMVGLVGLSLTAPWIGDLIADHFRAPTNEEEDISPKRCKK